MLCQTAAGIYCSYVTVNARKKKIHKCAKTQTWSLTGPQIFWPDAQQAPIKPAADHYSRLSALPSSHSLGIHCTVKENLFLAEGHAGWCSFPLTVSLSEGV